MKKPFNATLGFLASLAVAGLLALPSAGWADGPVSFTNTAGITINDDSNPPTKATPYPSSIIVTGLTDLLVGHVTVTLTGLTHNWVNEVEILLVGPQNQTSMLMYEVGTFTNTHHEGSVTNLTLILDDDATNSMPNTPFLSGTYQPTAYFSPIEFDFPLPAPAGNSNAAPSLTQFNGTNPNGTWNLYVIDEGTEDPPGTITSWTLTITPAIPFFIAPDTYQHKNVVLSWPASVTGCTLQACNLHPPFLWTNIVGGPQPVIVGTQFVVTNPVTSSNTFYRLTR